MNKDNMKNMIVLKDLPSNIVDEAIVILKPNIKLKSLDVIDKKNKSNKKNIKQNCKKYIINEAEMIISNYISKIENDKKKTAKINKDIERKCKRLKVISIFLGVMFLTTFFIR